MKTAESNAAFSKTDHLHTDETTTQAAGACTVVKTVSAPEHRSITHVSIGVRIFSQVDGFAKQLCSGDVWNYSTKGLPIVPVRAGPIY